MLVLMIRVLFILGTYFLIIVLGTVLFSGRFFEIVDQMFLNSYQHDLI